MLIAKINDSDFFGGDSKYLDDVNRYGVRGVLTDGAGNVAMMKIENTEFYKLPGGSIEITETPKQAFLRELSEETGYSAEIISELGWIEEHKNKRRFCLVSHCFVAKTTSANCDATVLSEAEKNLGFKLEWMPFGKALDIVTTLLGSCNDYQMKFLLKREQLILEQSKDKLK